MEFRRTLSFRHLFQTVVHLLMTNNINNQSLISITNTVTFEFSTVGSIGETSAISYINEHT
jgi:hypothetical protein